jgi:predicted dehydrogenase
MADKKLKVGLIGVGSVAQLFHMDPWKELEAEGVVDVAGVCDIIPERVEMVAKKWEVPKTYTNYKTMLKQGDFDIIDICTQNRLHCSMTLDALKAGANVLCEKPMAMNSKEGQKMIAAAKECKRKLMVAQNMRFESANERIKAIIERGDLGEIYFGEAQYLRRRGIPGWGKFHIKRESAGGPLIDIGVHMLDLIIWLMGSPKPLSATGHVSRKFGDREDLCNKDWGVPYPPKEFDVEDHAVAFIRLDNGIALNLEVSWAANIPRDIQGLRILGDKAGITTDPLTISSAIGNSLTSMQYDWLPEQEGHRMEIRHITECVRHGLPVRVKPQESLRVQQILDAIYVSSSKGKEVAIK